MKSSKTNILHRLTAIIVFILSSSLYIATMAPSVSLWDCGEFISCAVRLEVGHPPGAPLYLMIARIFTVFASSASTIAWWSNLVSALASAAAVTLLYTIIRHIVLSTSRIGNAITVVISSAIGALLFAVTDTMWFSAVESEVYALSLFFTTITFWASLRWEKEFISNGNGVRWLFLIGYLIGLSAGVHLLNLLTIPVIVLFVYLRIKGINIKNITVALLLGFGILAILLFGVIQNGLWTASKLELLMVNGFGLPMQSGLITFTLLLFGVLFAVLFFTRKNNSILHFAAFGILLFLIGYGSYAMIIIRSSANTPINLNSPDDIFSFDSFINREQYGEKPLLYGPSFNSSPSGIEKKETYRRSGNRYEAFERNHAYSYDNNQKSIFPRMHSNQEIHKYGYAYWGGVDITSGEAPNFFSNLKYMMRYQIDFMYLRYFMWNFSGRQSEIQGSGDRLEGNWITGFDTIDALRLGNRKALHPDEASNKGRNRYFMLPLIFGVAGIIFMARKENKSQLYLWTVMFLLFMTGPAIVLYLNQAPFEPRERDYAYVGSFMAFSIFIGMGVFAFMHWIVERQKVKFGNLLTGIVSFLALPGLMLAQNYDDHNRAGRYIEVNLAKSYLESCEPNALLFTYGDNDTYPLWYAQEVERIRTDVRVINFGLMSTYWCVNQLTGKINDSEALKFSIPLHRYFEGDMDNALLLNHSDEFIELNGVLNLLASNNEETKLRLTNGGMIDFSPTTKFRFAVGDDTIMWQIDRDLLYKNDIALLDIIASNGGNRPIYFTSGSPADVFLGLDDYITYLGLVKRLDFKRISEPDAEMVEWQYDVFMNKVDLGEQGNAYYDSFIKNAFEVVRYRQYTNDLASHLIEIGEREKAAGVLKKSLRELPVETYVGCNGNIELPGLLHDAGLEKESQNVATQITMRHIDILYYLSMQNSAALGSMLDEELAEGEVIRQQLTYIKATELLDEMQSHYILMGL